MNNCKQTLYIGKRVSLLRRKNYYNDSLILEFLGSEKIFNHNKYKKWTGN